jgi:hypothetical protein
VTHKHAASRRGDGSTRTRGPDRTPPTSRAVRNHPG